MDDPTTTAAEGFGLMFYNARWYDVQLGRFAQADTIIPEQTQGTQAWDRYAYTNNNPVKYTDPSGHYTCDHITNTYAQNGCQASTPQAETFEEAERQKIVKNHTKSKPISGVHYGSSGNVGFALENTGYYQHDILFDWQEGIAYSMITTGEGGYLGTPTLVSGAGYVGLSNFYGISADSSVAQTMDILGGTSLDMSLEAGFDVGFGFSQAAGLSLPIDVATGELIASPAGPVYKTERASAITYSPVITSPLDVGGKVGKSYTTHVAVLFEFSWWPFR